ncbi:hypothetical protein AB0896_27445 [Streptomyces parvulus]|uniref:hypothetical protein n=1 Tax=Streptomyces parvulus TaxID=146923 RepID=UPI003454AD09
MTAPAQPRSFPTPGDLARRKPTTTPATAAATTARPQPDAPSKTRATRRAAREAAAPYVPAKLSAEESIAPGKLSRHEPFRKYLLFALRRSSLPSSSRLVAHDLMWRAGHINGRISPRMWPDNEHLALATGLTVAQVDVAVRTLTGRGWITYRSIAEGPNTGCPQRVLVIPAAALEDVRAFVTSRNNQGYTR